MGLLTQTQIAQFEEEGYLLVRGLTAQPAGLA